jgi:hypothetical protein
MRCSALFWPTHRKLTVAQVIFTDSHCVIWHVDQTYGAVGRVYEASSIQKLRLTIILLDGGYCSHVLRVCWTFNDFLLQIKVRNGDILKWRHSSEPRSHQFLVHAANECDLELSCLILSLTVFFVITVLRRKLGIMVIITFSFKTWILPMDAA